MKLKSGEKLGIQFRNLEFDAKSLNEEARTVELTISSNTPYDRWFGTEVLDHRSECIMMERMTSGSPLLFNHERNAHLGRIISCETDGEKLKVKAKFSQSAFAKEKMQDVKDGILRESSVGYIVHKFEIDEDEETYTATKWEPLEGSLVTIPADITVGVGRDSEQSTTVEVTKKIDGEPISPQKGDMPAETPPVVATKSAEEIARETEAQRITVKNDAREMLKLELARQKEIAAIARTHNIDEKVTQQYLDDDRKSADEFNLKVVLPALAERQSKPEGLQIGMKPKEVRRFSLLKLIRDIGTLGHAEGLEKEVTEATMTRFLSENPDESRKMRGVMIPDDILRAPLSVRLQTSAERAEYAALVRAQNATNFAAGGATVPDQFGMMIPLLYNNTTLKQAGATIISGLQGNLILPKHLTGATAYWVSETGTLTDSESTFGQLILSPHRVGATIPFTRQLAIQSSVSIEQFVMADAQMKIDLKIDAAGYQGLGAAGEPLGIANTAGINATVTFGGAAEWADIVEFETGIAVDNAVIGNMSFVISAATVGKWKTKLKDSVAGADYLIGNNNEMINGYPYQRTNNITGNIAFFGVFSQVILASWGGMEIIVDPYALKKSGQVEVTFNELVDVGLMQPLAMNVSTDTAAA